MSSLSQLQLNFAAALFDNNNSVETMLRATQHGTVASGLAIYRNNVYSNYRNNLARSYPVLERLVGADYFRQLCNKYIAATPSLSGDVRDYGASYADFLQAHEVATQLPYLPDVARLEWQCRQVLARARSAPPDLGFFQTLNSDRYPDLHVELNHASALLASPYPVLRIWQINQPDHVGEETIDLNMGASHMLVLRHQNTVSVLELCAAEFTFLSQLQQDLRWGDALLAAQAITPDFDLGSCLLRHVNNGAISRFIL